MSDHTGPIAALTGEISLEAVFFELNFKDDAPDEVQVVFYPDGNPDSKVVDFFPLDHLREFMALVEEHNQEN